MNRATRRKAAPPRPLLQTAMAALGGVATLAAVGVIVWEAVQPAAPATLSARIERVDQRLAAVAQLQLGISPVGDDAIEDDQGSEVKASVAGEAGESDASALNAGDDGEKILI